MGCPKHGLFHTNHNSLLAHKNTFLSFKEIYKIFDFAEHYNNYQKYYHIGNQSSTITDRQTQ